MSASSKRRIIEYGLVLVIIAVLVAIIKPNVGNTCGSTPPSRSPDYGKLQQISHAALVYASDHQGRLPEATDVWDYARILAETMERYYSDRPHYAHLWQSQVDPASASDYDKKLKIILPAKKGHPRELDPAFLKIKPAFAIPVGRRLHMNHPATTPIAWTRGLQTDGTWAKHSPYGGEGGYIVFLGGNVAFYLNLTSAGGELIGRDGNKTANILDALPVGCRISEYQPTPAEQNAWAAEIAQ
jgi:hypothetical protein